MARDIVKDNRTLEIRLAIDKLLEEMSSKERFSYVEEIYNKYHCVSDVMRVKLNDKQKDFCKHIFELCPKCNCIPIAMETQYEDDCELLVEIDEFMDHISTYRDENEYIIPFFDDEMTRGQYKEMMSDYNNLVKSLDLIGGRIDGCDYCNDYHISTFVITKDNLEIKFLPDINR